MKQGWEIKKLGEVCDILNGYAFKSEKYTSEGVRVLRITNVQKGYVVDDDPKFYPKEEMANLQQYVLKENDLLMSLTGNVGRVGLLQNEMLPAALNQRVACLRIKNEQLYINYLFHFLNSDKFENDAIFSASGIAQKNMSTEWLKKYTIPVPPREEQERIVEILDREFERIDALKANAEQNLQHAKDLFQAALKQELQPKEGWVTASLNDLYDVRDGTHDSPKYTQQGYPFVTSKNLKDGKIDMSDVKYISKEDYDKINERSKVDVGDILFAMIGSNLGHPALVVDEPNYAIKNVALFKVPSSQSSRLLLYLLSSDLIMDKINKEKSGSSQPFVSLKYLRTFKVSIPMEYEQQEELALRIERLDRISKRLQSKYINIIALCDDMKQALLRKAFNGEL